MWYPDTFLAIHYPDSKKVEISKYPGIPAINIFPVSFYSYVYFYFQFYLVKLICVKICKCPIYNCIPTKLGTKTNVVRCLGTEIRIEC